MSAIKNYLDLPVYKYIGPLNRHRAEDDGGVPFNSDGEMDYIFYEDTYFVPLDVELTRPIYIGSMIPLSFIQINLNKSIYYFRDRYGKWDWASILFQYVGTLKDFINMEPQYSLDNI